MSAEICWEADPAALLRALAQRVAEASASEGHARADFSDLLSFYQTELWKTYDIPVEAVDSALNEARSTLGAYQAGRGHALDRLDHALNHDPAVLRHLMVTAPGVPVSLVRERLIADAVRALDSNVDIGLVAVARLIEARALERDEGRTL